MIPRRNFLGGFAAAIFGGRQAVDAVASVTPRPSLPPLGPLCTPFGDDISNAPQGTSNSSWKAQNLNRLRLLKATNPEWWQRQCLAEAKDRLHSRYSDIESFRSVSPAAKQQMVIDRNLRLFTDIDFDRLSSELSRELWERSVASLLGD